VYDIRAQKDARPRVDALTVPTSNNLLCIKSSIVQSICKQNALWMLSIQPSQCYQQLRINQFKLSRNFWLFCLLTTLGLTITVLKWCERVKPHSLVTVATEEDISFLTDVFYVWLLLMLLSNAMLDQPVGNNTVQCWPKLVSGPWISHVLDAQSPPKMLAKSILALYKGYVVLI
jgi:hypothetical protein